MPVRSQALRETGLNPSSAAVPSGQAAHLSRPRGSPLRPGTAGRWHLCAGRVSAQNKAPRVFCLKTFPQIKVTSKLVLKSGFSWDFSDCIILNQSLKPNVCPLKGPEAVCACSGRQRTAERLGCFSDGSSALRQARPAGFVPCPAGWRGGRSWPGRGGGLREDFAAGSRGLAEPTSAAAHLSSWLGAQAPGGSRAGGPGVVEAPGYMCGGACLVVGGRAPRGSAQPPRRWRASWGGSSSRLGLWALAGAAV